MDTSKRPAKILIHQPTTMPTYSRQKRRARKTQAKYTKLSKQSPRPPRQTNALTAEPKTDVE
jgi:hypothetical protein